MTLLFDDAKWMLDHDGTWLMIKGNRDDIVQFCGEMKQGKKYRAEFKEHRKKRSLDANAMAWKLMGELSAVLRIPLRELYQQYVQDVGDNFEIVPVREDKLDAWDRVWCAGHYGRTTVDLGECRNIPHYHYMKSFIASSDYDTAQMSRLLDLIIADCRENGIDVMSERERTLLIDEWGDKQ